jgi:hypothetical protein
MIPSRGVPVFTFNPWEFLAEVVCARENIPTETFRCVSASLPWTCALIRILAAAHVSEIGTERASIPERYSNNNKKRHDKKKTRIGSMQDSRDG